jgi:hypothetical protein
MSVKDAPEVGRLMVDTTRNKVGRVVEVDGYGAWLRPPRGGLEWVVTDTDKLEPVLEVDQ